MEIDKSVHIPNLPVEYLNAMIILMVMISELSGDIDHKTALDGLKPLTDDGYESRKLYARTFGALLARGDADTIQDKLERLGVA